MNATAEHHSVGGDAVSCLHAYCGRARFSNSERQISSSQHALSRAVRSLGVTRDSRVSREDRSWLISQERATVESRSPRVPSGNRGVR